MKLPRPIVLVILDGWGIGTNDEHNAIFLAKTPVIDDLLANYPSASIGAAGEHIGLEPGHQGTTEVGHLIIAAGRNVLLPQSQVRRATESGELKKNTALKGSLTALRKTGGRLHCMGLLSDKGVHSYDATLHAMLELARESGIPDDKIFIHVFSDGRDSPPQSVKEYLARLSAVGIGRVASVMGRYWAMDRDHRWERVEEAYRVLTEGRGQHAAPTAEDAVEQAYARGETDEFIRPTVILPEGHLQDGDVLWNFNFRVDREIEITQAFCEDDFADFHRAVRRNITYVALTDYYKGIPCPVVFVREHPSQTLGEAISRAGYTQFRCTETEKWVYMTKIFNGLREEPFPGEERLLIPSDKIPTYDLRPEMKAREIAEAVAKKIRGGAHDFYFLNIANADILGHTGNKAAAIKGVEAVDGALGILREAVREHDGVLCITADHGDAEIMWDVVHNQPHTTHTDALVPFLYVDDENTAAQLRDDGALQDIAPTLLTLAGLPCPDAMTGKSLLV